MNLTPFRRKQNEVYDVHRLMHEESAVASITKVVLKGFKKFDHLKVEFESGLNILLGDNEAGKSTLLLAIDLVLSASRSRVESYGIESLFPIDAVEAFMSGQRKFIDLPKIEVEVFLTYSGNSDFNGNHNDDGRECDGIKMVCEVPLESSKIVNDVLGEPSSVFPFEFYIPKFLTFAGHTYHSYRKHVAHLVLDSARIDSDYASREYTKSIFSANTDAIQRSRLESDYRQSKDEFKANKLGALNADIVDFSFSVRTSSKSNLETDLRIIEGGVPLDLRGKGRQCQVKTDFALAKRTSNKLDVLLLEEPENHLSHTSTRRLIEKLSSSSDRQIICATHSSMICSRLDLRKAILLGRSHGATAMLKNLSQSSALFFIKAPDNNVLEFALAKKVILVEGDADFILISALYQNHSDGATLESDGVHVISVGGTCFKSYMELAKLLGVRTAVIRDNDRHFHENCVENYAGLVTEKCQVFSDPDESLYTFEVSIYAANRLLCEELFALGRRTLTPLEYMLGNKTDAAFELLEKYGSKLVAPTYIQEAIEWIRK